jgi:hypothetical protein
MLPMTTKTCSRCGRRKPLGAFYKQQGGAQSRRGMCKECFRAAERGCLCPRFKGPAARKTYFPSIVEFDSYEAAMEASNRPETQEFFGRLSQLMDGPPKFYNLDVVDTWEFGR